MNAFLEVCTQICGRTREGATKSVGVSREVLGREVRLECILKGLGEAEKRVESMPSIKHRAGKPSEFRETQVVQSVIYSSEGGRRVTGGKKKVERRLEKRVRASHEGRDVFVENLVFITLNIEVGAECGHICLL